MTPEGALAIMEPAKRHPAREGWCDCDAMQCPWWQGYAGYAGGATVQPAAFDTAESPKIGKPLVLAFGYHRHVWLLAMFSQSRSFKNRLQGSHGIMVWKNMDLSRQTSVGAADVYESNQEMQQLITPLQTGRETRTCCDSIWVFQGVNHLFWGSYLLPFGWYLRGNTMVFSPIIVGMGKVTMSIPHCHQYSTIRIRTVRPTRLNISRPSTHLTGRNMIQYVQPRYLAPIHWRRGLPTRKDAQNNQRPCERIIKIGSSFSW